MLLAVIASCALVLTGCGGSSVDGRIQKSVEQQTRSVIEREQNVNLSAYEFTCSRTDGDAMLRASWRCEMPSSVGTLVCAVETTFDATADKPRVTVGNCDAQH